MCLLAAGQEQFPDPIANLVPTYGEDLVPGYSQLAPVVPVMSGIDMLRMAVPGSPGEDYPIYPRVPETGFSCEGRTEGGYYADTEAECQPFHICTANSNGGLSKYSFLCPNGTLFNQEFFVCEYWFNVDCSKAESFYELNDQIGDTQTGAASSPVGIASPLAGYNSPPRRLPPPPTTKPTRARPRPAVPSRPAGRPASSPLNDPDEGRALSSPSAYEPPSPDAASAPASGYQPALDSYGSPSAPTTATSPSELPSYGGNGYRPQPPGRRPRPGPGAPIKSGPRANSARKIPQRAPNNPRRPNKNRQPGKPGKGFKPVRGGGAAQPQGGYNSPPVQELNDDPLPTYNRGPAVQPTKPSPEDYRTPPRPKESPATGAQPARPKTPQTGYGAPPPPGQDTYQPSGSGPIESQSPSLPELGNTPLTGYGAPPVSPGGEYRPDGNLGDNQDGGSSASSPSGSYA